MNIKAKQAAQSAMDYMNSMDTEYGQGASADNMNFGYSFATECVNQIMNKINDMPVVTWADFNNEFKKLIKVTSSLNSSEFAFGIDLFKTTLERDVGKNFPDINMLFSESNIKSINKELFNNAEDKRVTTEILLNINVPEKLRPAANKLPGLLNKVHLHNEEDKALTEKLNKIALDDVANFFGGSFAGYGNKWNFSELGHSVDISGDKWKNWNTNTGGVGAISLAADILECNSPVQITTQKQKTALWYNAREQLLAEFGPKLENQNNPTTTPRFKK